MGNAIKGFKVNNEVYKYDYGSLENLPAIVELTLPANSWVGASSPYTQEVTISGTDANTKVDLQPNATVLDQMLTDGTTALYIINNNGTLTAYAIDGKPSAAITVQATISTVSVPVSE